MKKAMLLAAAAVTVLSSSVALANPVELNGTISYQYRNNTNEVDGDKSGNKLTFTLDALTKLDDHFDVYARLAAQHVTQLGFAADFADKSKHTEGGIDQYGFIYKNAGVDYKIGRQSVTLGETALLYNNAAYIGQNKFADGVTVTTTTGVTDVKVVAVQEDNIGDLDNKLFAVQASYKPVKNLKVGGVLAKYDYKDSTVKDTNHWAINAGYTLGKAGLTGEYTQSNADTDNKAYAAILSYDFDGVNSVYVLSHRTEDHGDIGQMTDFDPGEKGMYYGYDHKLSKDTTFSLMYKDNENVKTGKDNTSFRATLTYKF